VRTASFPWPGGVREGAKEQGKSDGSQLVVAPMLRAFELVDQRGKMDPSFAKQEDNAEARLDGYTELPPSITPHGLHFTHARELSSSARQVVMASFRLMVRGRVPTCHINGVGLGQATWPPYAMWHPG